MNRTTHTSPARFAAIIDVENLLIRSTRTLSLPESTSVLDQVKLQVGPIPTRTAIGPVLMRSHLPVIAAFGGGLTVAGSDKDAADRALLEAGQVFIDQGITDLVIGSGDHAFAELASLARLHVIAHPASLSRRLRVAATSVTLLQFSSAGQAANATGGAMKAAI